jgi:hypothetical protein
MAKVMTSDLPSVLTDIISVQGSGIFYDRLALNASSFSTISLKKKEPIPKRSRHCSSCSAPTALDRQTCEYCGTIY